MRFIGNDPNIIDAYYTATAEGAIAAGKPVIVEADGDVTQVAGEAAGAGSAATFESAETYIYERSVVFDSSANKVVIFYRDAGNSGYGTAIVATVSNKTISFGTPVVFESASVTTIAASFDTNENKTMVLYRDGGNSNYGTAIVCSVSGTTPSFGTAVVWLSRAVSRLNSCFTDAYNRHVAAFENNVPGVGNTVSAIVGSISGTTPSFGSVKADVAGDSQDNHMYPTITSTENVSSRCLIAWQNGQDSDKGYARVGTIAYDSNTISFSGSAAAWESSGIANTYISSAYGHAKERVVIIYKVGSASKAIALEAGAGSFTAGTAITLTSNEIDYNAVVYDPDAGKFVVAVMDDDDSDKGKIIGLSISGSTLTADTPIVAYDNQLSIVAITYDTNADKSVVAFQDIGGDFTYGKAFVFGFASTNLTSENYIGIAADTYADNEDSTIGIVGCIDRNQTGLTAGQQYFVQTDGTLSTTAGDPSVLAGTAISATELVVKE